MDLNQVQQKIPSVAIIICNYNYGHYICDAIESASTQDYPSKCIIVVDDGSTDDSVQKIEEFVLGKGLVGPIMTENEEFTLSHMKGRLSCELFLFRLKKNSGPSKARNTAIRFALANHCHVIAVLDADDIMYPNKISSLIKPIMLDPERIGVTYGDYLIKGKDGVHRYESKPVYDYMRLLQGDCHIHSGALISSLAIKPFLPTPYNEDMRVAEDLALWYKVMKSGQFIAYHISEPLTIVRSHDNDSTSSVAKEIWQRDYQKALMYR